MKQIEVKLAESSVSAEDDQPIFATIQRYPTTEMVSLFLLSEFEVPEGSRKFQKVPEVQLNSGHSPNFVLKMSVEIDRSQLIERYLHADMTI